jgi:hypothetical protein
MDILNTIIFTLVIFLFLCIVVLLLSLPFIVMYGPYFLMYRNKYEIQSDTYLGYTQSISFYESLKLFFYMYMYNNIIHK